jgi:hypothetical protein
LLSTLHVIVFVACLICGAVSGLAGTIVHLRMVDKVNAALPSERRFEVIGWGWFKIQRLLREYRRLYPEGPLIRPLMIWNSLGFAAIVVIAAVFMRSIILVLWFASMAMLILWLRFRTSRPES